MSWSELQLPRYLLMSGFKRVCRLTVLKMKSIVTRCRDFWSLVEETLLYKEPPTHHPALHWGRTNEPRAVSLYEAKFPELTVRLCDLIIHPTLKFVGASPDWFVHNPGANLQML